MSDLVEIFVTEIAEEVTLNVTPNLIEVNVIKGVVPTNPITGTGTTNFLPKFTGASTLGNSQIFDNGTNVGIGTTSPNSRLHVGTNPIFAIDGRTAAIYGSANSETIFTVSTSGLEYPQLLDFGVNFSGLYSTISARRFTSAENTLILQPNGGNVGIGTTSPTSKLHVTGLPSFADNAAALSGGLTVGAFYHTAGVLKVVI
jgi:hypothetical protein